MKLVVFLLLVLFSCNVFSGECSSFEESTDLRKIVFKISSRGKLEAFSRERRSDYQIELSAPNVQSVKVFAMLRIKDNKGKICKTINLEVDPTLLCRDANGAIEPWTYWVFKPQPDSTPEYSVVSMRSNLDEEVYVKSSRICGYSTILGRVGIVNSNIESKSTSSQTQSIMAINGSAYFENFDMKGIFRFEDVSNGTGEIVLKDVNIAGNPTIKSHAKRIYMEDVEISGNPIIEEKAPVGLSESIELSVFMKDVDIVGSPYIVSDTEGIDLKTVQIEGSPSITGEIIFDNVRIENDGTYTSESKLNGTAKLRSVIFGNALLKGNNNHFSGFYYVNKYVENSTILGEVVHDESEYIVNVANLTNLGNLNKKFVSSTFKGVGYILGSVEGGVTIHGYEVAGNTSGINFCATCKAHNGSKLRGAVYTEGNVDLDNADVAGTSLRFGQYVIDVRESLIQNSQVLEASSVVNSTVMDQSILNGHSTVNQSFVSSSRISENARIYANSTITAESVVSGSAQVVASVVTNHTSISGTANISGSSLDNSTVTCNAVVTNKVLSGQYAGCNYPNKKIRKTGELIRKEIDQVMEDNVSKLVEKNNQANKFKFDTIQRYYLSRKI